VNNDDVKVKISSVADNSGINSTERELNRLDDSGGRLGKTLSGLSGMLQNVAIVAGTAAVAAAGAAVAVGFQFNSAIEQSQAKIQAFTKDAKKTGEVLAFVKDEAAKTQFSFSDMADAAANLIPASKQSGVALETLVKQAEVLAAINPEEGLKGAAFSLREALSGDFVSVVERFNLPRQRLNQLKAEGVPAIEAIRTALKEMGIDYDVVAAQGKTTAARFDQIKDLLTQLAGVATKPIFDALSVQLGRLGDYIQEHKPELEALAKVIGENLLAGVQFIVNAFQEWLKFMQPTFDYIGKNTDALRILGDGLKIAGMIIGGIVLLIATGLVGAFATLVYIIDTTRKAFDGFASYTSIAAGWIVDRYNEVVNWFKALPGKIAAAVSGVADALTRPFRDAYNGIKGVVDNISGYVKGIGDTISGGVSNIKIPGFADGVRNFAGGLAVVGERGPELVHLPKGSNVYSNGDSQNIMSGRGGTTIYQTNNVYQQVDIESANRELGFRLSHA
jgi:hypothetical protein